MNRRHVLVRGRLGRSNRAAPGGARCVSGVAPERRSGQQRSDLTSIDPKKDAGVSDVVGGSLANGGARAVGDVRAEDRRRPADLRARVQGRRLGDARLPGFAEHRPDEGGRGSGHRLRRRRPGGAVGQLVRAERPPDSLATNIFASRFSSPPNLWLPSGQDRSGGASIPSLNIHTNRTAEEPSVAGGAAVAGNHPVPWVVWREHDGATTDGAGKFQIFVSRGFAARSCAGVTRPG